MRIVDELGARSRRMGSLDARIRKVELLVFFCLAIASVQLSWATAQRVGVRAPPQVFF